MGGFLDFLLGEGWTGLVALVVGLISFTTQLLKFGRNKGPATFIQICAAFVLLLSSILIMVDLLWSYGFLESETLDELWFDGIIDVAIGCFFLGLFVLIVMAFFEEVLLRKKSDRVLELESLVQSLLSEKSAKMEDSSPSVRGSSEIPTDDRSDH